MKQEPGRQQPGIPSLQGGEEVKFMLCYLARVLSLNRWIENKGQGAFHG